MSSEQFSLCWDNFHKNMSSGMNSLLENEDLVDVTLAVQGKCLKAHKMVLSVCSPYFKELFKSNPCKHPIVFMKDVSYEALSDLLQFMYQGEVQVSQENLTTFIKTAEALQIKGLTGDGNGSTDSDVVEVPAEKRTPHVEDYKPVSVPRPKKQQPPPAPMSSPSVKRQRLSASTSDTQPLPPPVTKVEPIAPPQPVPISTPESSPLHFKTEPYEQSVSLLDETGDDTFNEDTLDETVGDDNEDYSMMESGSGEEPQAGTSTDGAGEGQDFEAVQYLKLTHTRRMISRASAAEGFTELRFDGKDHFMVKREKQRRCQGDNCKVKPLTYCGKCSITLCKNCFVQFHKQ
ncbi:protein tramtrack, beta isoform isoform X12 [Diabrotica virgifera virgifera]|uniref:Protein tramtrack, beta isoform-like isoform X19 n=1 Tax=Diabrotica virgifera virgifera TaxID=50390 RepID=A0A6P7GTV9_DIAVI|nr:protein tramtrack, beta isoform isoform X12 [Diabrotica virgifera virgifera]